MRWYLTLMLVTWAFAPVVRWLCHALHDRGVTIARPLGVLFAVYPAWLISSLGVVPFGASAVAVAVIGGGGLSWILAARRDSINRVWLRAMLATELVSFALFMAYIWLRGYTPQILGTEKPMDVAFLASSARAISLPPPDPWFAGEPINYYYLGYLLHGTIARLAGVPPETGFNLALASIFSATMVAAFGIAWNVVRPRLGPGLGLSSGCSAAFLVALAGNLYAPLRLLQAPADTVFASWWDGAKGIGWRASRIVCDGPRVDNQCRLPATETINEFPFFSVLLGDLHPHLMALPYTLVAVALAWNLAQHQKETAARDRVWLVRLSVAGGVVGSLYPLNAWDFPTFLFIAGLGVWVGWGTRLRSTWRPLLLLGFTSLLAWLPFWLTYVPPTREMTASLTPELDGVPVVSSLLSVVALHTAERTSVAEYLTIFGVPYAAGIGLLIVGELGSKDAWQVRDRRILITAAVATIVPGVLISAPVLPLCGIPLALAGSQLRRLRGLSPWAFALCGFAVVWTLSIGVEIIYIRDAFEDRMNTLFKFYNQTWTIYGLAAAVTIGVLWVAMVRPWQRAGLALVVVVAILAGAAYPVVSSYQWTEQFADWSGLDGLAYAEAEESDDVAAIRWLARNAEPGDVVLEAAGCAYLPFNRLPFNRVAAFTGVPTVIGWEGHERQWRAGQPELLDEIAARQDDVATLYEHPDASIFERYGVDWVFVGEYEQGNWQTECSTAGSYRTGDFASLAGSEWEEAFRAGDTAIYRRTAGVE